MLTALMTPLRRRGLCEERDVIQIWMLVEYVCENHWASVWLINFPDNLAMIAERWFIYVAIYGSSAK